MSRSPTRWRTPRQAPIIGIPVQRSQQGPEYRQPCAYAQAIERAGGMPLLLPLLDTKQALSGLFGLLDGLCLAGGGDIDPDLYGQTDSGKLLSVDPQRDQVELTLTRWALDASLPILGICRGIQVLNVAAGGTLFQDVPSEIRAPLDHRSGPEVAPDFLAHRIRLTADSRLARAMGLSGSPELNGIGVNSTHHQAIREVAPGFVASAWAEDGVIEAIEGLSAASALGVQWHPERLVATHPAMAHLFHCFVEDGMAQRRTP